MEPAASAIIRGDLRISLLKAQGLPGDVTKLIQRSVVDQDVLRPRSDRE